MYLNPATEHELISSNNQAKSLVHAAERLEVLDISCQMTIMGRPCLECVQYHSFQFSSRFFTIIILIFSFKVYRLITTGSGNMFR
jgi:hypothetical protein